MKYLAINIKKFEEGKAVQRALFDMGLKWSKFGKELLPIKDEFIVFDNTTIYHVTYIDSDMKIISFSDFFSTYSGCPWNLPVSKNKIEKLTYIMPSDDIVDIKNKINEIIDFINK